MATKKTPAKKVPAARKSAPVKRAAAKKPVPSRKAGRPSDYTEALADAICERLANKESLRTICARAGMPDRKTVDRWAEKHPEFAAKRARAREAQADNIFDDMADIESRTLKGKIAPNAARAVLSSMQWRASKLAPKSYGDKVVQEITGKDGGPIETRELSDTERAVRLAALIARGKARVPKK